MSDALVLLCILAGLIVLDVMAIRFGYDSRDGFRWDKRLDYRPPYEIDDGSSLR